MQNFLPKKITSIYYIIILHEKPHFTFLEYFGLFCENFYSVFGSIIIDPHLLKKYLYCKINKRNNKHFNNCGYSLSFLLGIFLKHL